jgi:hypothetical protein
MSESWADQVSRLEAMASGDVSWDLSPNDMAAIRAVIDRVADLEADIRRARSDLEAAASQNPVIQGFVAANADQRVVLAELGQRDANERAALLEIRVRQLEAELQKEHDMVQEKT